MKNKKKLHLKKGSTDCAGNITSKMYVLHNNFLCIYLTNRLHSVVHLFSNRSQRMSECTVTVVKTKSGTQELLSKYVTGEEHNGV